MNVLDKLQQNLIEREEQQAKALRLTQDALLRLQEARAYRPSSEKLSEETE